MNFVDALLTEAVITAPGCPETLVERALRVAATEFYRTSEAWRVTLDPAPAIRGRQEVELEFPAGTFPVRYFWARLDGRQLVAISERRVEAVEGTPRAFAATNDSGVVLLDAIPMENYLRNGLVVHVAVAPTNEQSEVPDNLFNIHRNGILYSAQRSLLAMPNVPWGDLNMAAVYAQMAQQEMLQARRNAESRQSGVARKTRYGGI